MVVIHSSRYQDRKAWSCTDRTLKASLPRILGTVFVTLLRGPRLRRLSTRVQSANSRAAILRVSFEAYLRRERGRRRARLAGSMLLSFAVWMSVYIKAAGSAPRSGEQHMISCQARGRAALVRLLFPSIEISRPTAS